MKPAVRAGLACVFSLAFASTAHAQSQRFAASTSIGDGLLEVKLADASRRNDGRWLTLGSRVDGESRETPYLILRSAGGERLAAISIAPDDGLSWTPSSMVAVGNDVVVAGIEYDHRDFSAVRGLFLARLNASLNLVWSRHLRDAALWFDNAKLRAIDGQPPLVVGMIQNVVEGNLDAGDGFVAEVDVDDGSLVSPRALGVAESHERAIDAVAIDSERQALLLEVWRDAGSGLETSDGIVALDANGMPASARLVGHTLPVGVRAAPQRLLRDGTSWVLAGRRTSIGPNFFYLHRLAEDFTPVASRTLVPFFNAMDVAVRDGSVYLYGEANGEAQDAGSVLMRLDADFAIGVQRRYGTENLTFPTGAFAFGEGGLLLSLGALREADGFAYESVSRVDADGVGLLCHEGVYAGFSTTSDAPTEPTGWTPAATALDVQTATIPATAAGLETSDMMLCAEADGLLFRTGFEEES